MQNHQLSLEYIAYSIKPGCIVKKKYVRLESKKNLKNGKDCLLSEDELLLVEKALRSKYIRWFSENRYSLYDISFRHYDFKKEQEIGFSFKDDFDIDYIEPVNALSVFGDYISDLSIRQVDRILDAVFFEKPSYNPIFMIGLLLSPMHFVSAKVYIRFDVDEYPEQQDRIDIIKRVALRVNPSFHEKNNSLLNIVELFEKKGFVFRFFGIDYYHSDQEEERIKLYFRYSGTDSMSLVKNMIVEVASLLHLSGVEIEVLLQQNKEISSIALSTDLFESVNGLQIYYNPR